MEDMERESLPELLFRKHTSRQSGRREARGRENLTSSVESIASSSPFGVVIIVERRENSLLIHEGRVK